MKFFCLPIFVMLFGCSDQVTEVFIEDEPVKKSSTNQESDNASLNEISVEQMAAYFSGYYKGTSHAHTVVYYDSVSDSIHVYAKTYRSAFSLKNQKRALANFKDHCGDSKSSLKDNPVEVDGKTMYVVTMEDIFPDKSKLKKYFGDDQISLLRSVTVTEGHGNVASRGYPLIYTHGTNESQRFEYCYENEKSAASANSLDQLWAKFIEQASKR